MKKKGEKLYYMGRQCRRKEKKMVFRVHGNADSGRSKTYRSIYLAVGSHDPINHENYKERRRVCP